MDKLKKSLKIESYSMMIFNMYIITVSGFAFLSLLSFAVDPFGRMLVEIEGHTISNVTGLTFSVAICVMLVILDHVAPLPRILCSLSLPVLGMAFHEMFWHYGCWLTWKTGLMQFWGLYTVAVLVGTFILDGKYGILQLNVWKVVAILVLFSVYVEAWMTLYDISFYHTLVLYEQGLGIDPHTPYHYATASLGRMMWLLLVVGPGDDEI